MAKVIRTDIEPFYCEKKFGEPATLVMNEQLSNIKVELINPTDYFEVINTMCQFALNGWNTEPRTEFTEEEEDKCLSDLFGGTALPLALETFRVSFSVSGLDLVDVTHLIRHRAFTFSAQCSDRDLRDLELVVKPSILANEEFRQRFEFIAHKSAQLYADMLDSGEVSVFDARTILPVNKSHYYLVSGCLKDIVNYVKQRIDEHIQTQSDNVVALMLWAELCKVYPFLVPLIDLKGKDMYHINQVKAGKTTIFPPSKKNDVMDWDEDQFFHDKHRDQFPGSDVYLGIKDKLTK